MATTQQIDPMTQVLLSLLGGSSDQSQSGTKTTTGGSTTSNTGSQTTKVSADTAALQQVFSKLMAGPTQQDIQAIFDTGAKEVPGLQTAFAQSAGLRTDSNSALASSLGDLQSRITGKVLEQKTAMLGQAAGVAQALGQLTQEQSTSTSNSSTVNNNSTETSKGTGSQDTGLNSDALRKLLIGGSLLGGLVGKDGGGYGPGAAELFKMISGGKSLTDIFSGGSLTIDPNGLGINIPDALKNFDAGSGSFDWNNLFSGNAWEDLLKGL